MVKEIIAGGGTASLSRAEFLEGLTVAQVEALFCAARDEEYEKIVYDACLLKESLAVISEQSASQPAHKKRFNRLRNRFSDTRAIDFFHAPARVRVEGILAECEVLLGLSSQAPQPAACFMDEYIGKTWVTRSGIHEDRMACAWLIKRFIDEGASFRFLDNTDSLAAPEECTFDMFAGDFTHRGDRCSFEVLLDCFGIDDTSLNNLAEIIHDIDLKDGKYDRTEAQGVLALFRGITVKEKDDHLRLERGNLILDALYASFSGVSSEFSK